MNFKPVRDFLVVEPLDSGEHKTASGIVLPDSAKKENPKGEVVRLGQGRWSQQHERFHDFSCRVGDVVLFQQFAGFTLEEDGREFRVIRDHDIVGVFEG